MKRLIRVLGGMVELPSQSFRFAGDNLAETFRDVCVATSRPLSLSSVALLEDGIAVSEDSRY